MGTIIFFFLFSSNLIFHSCSASQSDSQTMPPRSISDAEHEWKIKFDEKRKKNIIVHGMYDANSYAEDMSFIRHMFRDIGCRENYSQISRLTRLGTRRYNRNRTLMICFYR